MAIKGQTLADFISELTPGPEDEDLVKVKTEPEHPMEEAPTEQELNNSQPDSQPCEANFVITVEKPNAPEEEHKM